MESIVRRRWDVGLMITTRRAGPRRLIPQGAAAAVGGAGGGALPSKECPSLEVTDYDLKLAGSSQSRLEKTHCYGKHLGDTYPTHGGFGSVYRHRKW